VGKRVEDAKVAVRNVRRDVLEDIRDLHKEKSISEDEMYQAQDELQELTDKYIKMIDDEGKQKMVEVMEV
jgi:ribosome recycling factor